MIYYLAQLNIAKLKAPLDDPLLHGFVSKLDEVNAIADAYPGFVWRMVEEGEYANVRKEVFNDPTLVINLSIWESEKALKEFVYRSDHVQVYKQRAQWFHKPEDHYMVLWWIEKGRIPSAEEAKNKLADLRKNGPSSNAFTFRNFFEPPKT